MRKFIWIAALTAALGATMVSCGDDGDIVASTEVSDFGGERLMSIGEDTRFSYNSDGTLRQIVDYGSTLTFDYEKGIMTFSEDGENQEAKFTTNSKGYITGFSTSGSEEDEDVTYNYSVSYEFEYNGSDHITSASVNEVSINAVTKEKTYEYNVTWKFFWNGDLLSKVEVTGEDRDIEGTYNWSSIHTYSYEGSLENRYMQYTDGIAGEIDIDSSVEPAMCVGLFGKGPAKYPVKISGDREMEFEYKLNSKGLVETETSIYKSEDDDYIATTNYSYGSHSRAESVNAGSGPQRVKAQRGDNRNHASLFRRAKR